VNGDTLIEALDLPAGALAAGNNFVNTVVADGLAYAGAPTWGTFLGGTGLDSANPFDNGLSANLYLFGQTGTEEASAAELGTFARAMTVDGRALTVTVFQDENGIWDVKISAQVLAVPEADTYAMFLAGLGLMGFVARRKQA
jgi:hypothetical protein